MFAKATSKFVTEIDPDGCLIPVSRLNDRFWFWQRPKYLPSDFTLNDLLQGETKIDPGMEFSEYNSTLENNTSGAAEAGFGPGNVNLSGKVKTKRLVLDMQHSLIQQTQQKRTEVFALVKERIVTTQPCTVTEEVQEGGSCGAFFGLTENTKTVSVKNGSHQSDSNVSVEIPAKTALAYCLIELSVKATGQFGKADFYFFLLQLRLKLCFWSFKSTACFTVAFVSLSLSFSLFLSLSLSELNELQSQFAILSGLPASTRSSLLQQLTALLKDKTAISALDLAVSESSVFVGCSLVLGHCFSFHRTLDDDLKIFPLFSFYSSSMIRQRPSFLMPSDLFLSHVLSDRGSVLR
uniref:Gasdermin Eb n=1 Tax=Astyanax mexicanus TaxID=7994 RepID=A0A3B1JXD9_ASTMX